jgi:hypothetical protein
MFANIKNIKIVEENKEIVDNYKNNHIKVSPPPPNILWVLQNLLAYKDRR